MYEDGSPWQYGTYRDKAGNGCLPIQRCSTGEAVKILQAAYDGGINFFDTANSYTDSEEKSALPCPMSGIKSS